MVNTVLRRLLVVVDSGLAVLSVQFLLLKEVIAAGGKEAEEQPCEEEGYENYFFHIASVYKWLQV